MSRITDYILEPKVVYTEGGFLVRVKVIDDYKYKKYIVSENLHYKTVQGTSFTITDADTTKQASITELKGNTTQEGTPTPSNPIEVQTVSGDNNIVVSNKNVLPFSNQNFNLKGLNYYVQNGSLFLNGTSTGETYSTDTNFKNNFSFYLEAGTYRISWQPITGISAYIKKYEDNTNLAQLTQRISNIGFTLNTRTRVYLSFYVYNATPSNANTKLMLEKGNQATDYTEHQRSRYRVDLGGKNKFNYQYSQLRNINRVTISEETNGFKLTSTGVAGYGFASLPIDNNLLGKQVTISCNSSGNKTPSARLFYHKASGGLTSNIGAFWTTNNAHTVTLPSTLSSGSTGIDIVFYISQGNNAEGDYVTFTNIQIEERKCSNTIQSIHRQPYRTM